MAASAEVLAGLRDVRLPDHAAWLADGLAGFSLGLAAALLLALVLGAWVRHAPTARERAMEELRLSSRLSPGDRLLSLARLAAGMAGRHPEPRAGRNAVRQRHAWEAIRAEIGAVLYRPGTTPDLDDLHRRIRALIARDRD